MLLADVCLSNFEGFYEFLNCRFVSGLQLRRRHDLH